MLKGEQHTMVRRCGDISNILIKLTPKQVALFSESFETEHHIVSGDRFAIMETGFRIKMESYPAVILRLFDGFGEDAVFGQWLIPASDQKRVVDIVMALGCFTLRAVAIKGVKITHHWLS